MTQTGKGDRQSQQRRRRDRYRGCPVCGIRGGCSECSLGATLVAQHDAADLALVVDGSYVPPPGRERQRNPGPSFGGAGLVLVRPEPASKSLGRSLRRAEILAERACGFIATSATDAEYQAVIRGARWAPGVLIYTDDRSIPDRLYRVGLRDLRVEFLPAGGGRGIIHDRAHLLSVSGRCRDAPSDGGAAVAKATKAVGLSNRQRRMLGVDILLEQARADPTFNGDFVALAERLGWTSGRSWWKNPTIAVAAKRWAEGSNQASRSPNS